LLGWRFVQHQRDFRHLTLWPMLVLMTLRCEQCGHENDSRYRFCGMCGAKLPSPPREIASPRADSPDPGPSAKPVRGPSFLGLADEPSDPVSYLLEDEPSTSHWGRYLVLTVFLGGAVAAGWHWRQDLRSLASRFSGGPSAAQSQQTSGLAPAPAAASSSETQASPGETPPVAQQTGTAVSSQAVPTSVPTASTPPTTQLPVPADDQAPTGTASPPNSAAPTGGDSPAASSQQPPPNAPPAAAVAGDNSQPANSDSKNEASEKGESPQEEMPAVKPRAATKASRSSAEQVAGGSESDALEIQGERYLYGNGAPANCALAQKSLLAAAEHSNSKAQSVLGTMYATGHCATRDLPLAYRWFARALRQDPGNLRIQDDLKVLWNQMSADERQLALRAER